MVEPSPDTRPSQTDLQIRQERYLAYRQAHHEERLATRRRILRWVIRLGTGAFSLALLLPALALRSLTREVTEVASGDTLVYASGDRSGLPVDVAALAPGTAVQAFPQGKSDNERNLVELVRLAGDLPTGLVAYSAICTHLGCTVLPQLSAQGYIICPCHGSVFDPAVAAAVVHGPANRPLPALPIGVLPEGHVVATGGFAGPVGPV
jgi:rieske iron-sulfur protein